MIPQKRFVLAIMLLTTGMLFARIVWVTRTGESGRKFKEYKLRRVVWPEERRQTAEKVKSRQRIDETIGATLVNLKPFINKKIDDLKETYNLPGFPAGTNIFGGVPFDVEGWVQLTGGSLQDQKNRYPAKIENIPIGRRCAKIHLLHGNLQLPPDSWGTTVASIILSYADGTKSEIDLIGGRHSFDWWGPTYRTGISPTSWTNAPGTELAWVGSNPAIRRLAPDYNLRLYKTTLYNPQPDVEVTSLDYVAALTETCPFLLGLTVE